MRVEAGESKLLIFETFSLNFFFFKRASSRGARAPKNCKTHYSRGNNYNPGKDLKSKEIQCLVENLKLLVLIVMAKKSLVKTSQDYSQLIITCKKYSSMVLTDKHG